MDNLINQNESFKNQLAREYYNIIFGAKLNLSSFDTCSKLPGVISFFSMVIGIFGLAYDDFNSKLMACIILIAGIIGLLLKPYSQNKEQYEAAGISLTTLSKKVESLFFQIGTEQPTDSDYTKFSLLQEEHQLITQPIQLVFSSWLAHYKVFSEQNSDWFCKQLNLTFWSDKIPLTLRLALLITLIGIFTYFYYVPISLYCFHNF
jgi:hypothetical protein